MKKRKNYSLVVLLSFAMLLSGCGKENNSTTTDAKVSNILSDVKEYDFTKGNQYTFDIEEDGYSCQVTVETWLGEQSSNDESVFHPANKNIAIPLKSSTDCVIPFAATVETTTANTVFTTDISIAFRTEEEMYKSFSSVCKLVDTAAIEDSINRFNDSGMAEYSWVNLWQGGYPYYEKTESNDEFVIFGYYTIPNSYSPTVPDGEFPPSALSLLLNIGFNTSNPIPSLSPLETLSETAEVGVHCDAIIPIQINK